MFKILNMRFLRNLLASILGLAIFSSLVILVVIVLLVSADDKVKIESNSILQVTLSKSLIDRPNTSKFNFANNQQCGEGLFSIQNAIVNAKTDPKIEALYLKVDEVQGSLANVASLKRTIEDFKNSGKKVIAYSEGLSQIGYYLAVSADSVFIDKMSFLEWKGLGAQLLYFKSMLNKIGVKAEPIRVGKFKSAIEPFVLDSMSKENEHQVKEMIDDVWLTMLHEVSFKRGVSINELNQIADDYGYLMSKEALNFNLVDKILYEDQVKNVLKSISGGKTHLVCVEDYNKVFENDFRRGRKVVVVNAEGAIIDADSETDVSAVKYGKILDDILKDKSVKAVVLRINSPGGSAMASEKLWRKLKLIQQKMPLIVSMGNVAASGGYYMASAGDTILAEKNTITGSIGVFGLMFNVSELTNTLGVNVEKVKTNELSDFPSFDRDLTVKEKERMKKGIETIYDVFISRVMEGRGLTKGQVENLAEGRVWTGSQALNLGLVDSIGGLNEAINIAVESAELKKYQIVHLPKEQTPIEALVNHFSKQSQIALPVPFESYNYMIQNPTFFKDFQNPQARLPYVLSIYPNP